MKNEDEAPDELLKLVYNIIEQIVKNQESYIKYINKKMTGFLVQKDIFDNFKTYICYKDLEKCVKDKIGFGKFKNSLMTMKKYIKFKKLKKKIKLAKINDSKKLIYNLCAEKKEYYIINHAYGREIMALQNIELENEKEITYEITKENIYIYFDKNEKISFKIKKEILIGESNLINQYENLLQNINKNEIKELEDNSKENILFNGLINEYKNIYKKIIEILIRFFIYQKEKTEKENKLFLEKAEQTKESVFLIDNDWFKNLKDFLEYKKLEEFINQQMNLEKINSKSEDKCFENIISKIPNEYFKIFIVRNKKII